MPQTIECDADAQFCDCAFHDNLRRALATQEESEPDARMHREAFPPDPSQRAEFHVGVIDADSDPANVFNGRLRLRLILDFEQALELQRCIVEAMQTKFIGNELLQIELEPGVLELYPNQSEPL